MSASQRDIVVVGGSAGAVDALIRLVSRLPPSVAAAIHVVVHLPPEGRSELPTILERAGPLRASVAEDGRRIAIGEIVVAPPGRHLTLTGSHVRLGRGPRENRARPAIDPLFRSAALYHASRTIGIVLSGALDDGAAGLRAIRDAGGLAVVQDPDDAFIPSMPNSAITAAEPDHILTADEIGRRLLSLLREPAPAGGLHREPEIA